MKKRSGILFIVIMAFLLIFSAGCTSFKENSQKDAARSDQSLDFSMQTELSVLQGEIFGSVKKMMLNAGDCAVCAGKEEPGAFKDKASEIISGDERIISAAYIGDDGVLKEIYPESEGIAPGDSLSYQDSVAFINERKIPILTDIFELKQGGYAAAVYYPVFSGNTYKGFISLTFSPEDIFSEYALPLKEETGFELMGLEKDGVILYDPDESETGTQTLNNSAYDDFPGIIKAMEKIAAGWSGNTDYSYYATGTDDVVEKRLFWTTISAGRNDWKIMVIRDR